MPEKYYHRILMPEKYYHKILRNIIRCPRNIITEYYHKILSQMPEKYYHNILRNIIRCPRNIITKYYHNIQINKMPQKYYDRILSQNIITDAKEIVSQNSVDINVLLHECYDNTI